MAPVAPETRPWINAYPLPNGPDLGDGTAYFVAPRSFPTSENFYTARLDHKLSDKDSLFGRYTIDTATTIPDNNVIMFHSNQTRNQYLSAGETRIFLPRSSISFCLVIPAPTPIEPKHC